MGVVVSPDRPRSKVWRWRKQNARPSDSLPWTAAGQGFPKNGVNKEFETQWSEEVRDLIGARKLCMLSESCVITAWTTSRCRQFTDLSSSPSWHMLPVPGGDSLVLPIFSDLKPSIPSSAEVTVVVLFQPTSRVTKPYAGREYYNFLKIALLYQWPCFNMTLFQLPSVLCF